jgi:hypothetical protein
VSSIDRVSDSKMVLLEAKHWIVEGELMVSFYLPGPIAPGMWQDYCDTIASGVVHKLLAASIGAVEIDATQRRQLSEALRGRSPVAVAIVTDEALMRGQMTATAWLGRIDVTSFPWHKLAEACHHLSPRDVTQQRALELVDIVRRRAEQ